MTPSRILLTLIVAFAATAAALTAALWMSPSFALSTLQSAVAKFTSYELHLEEPTLQWSPFTFQTDLLLLTYSDKSQPPLVSVQAVDLAISLRELILGEITGGHFEASNITYYLDPEGSTAPINIEALLSPLSRLPSDLNVASIHLISRKQNLWIFPVYDLRATRNDKGSMDITAGLSVAERKVELSAQADWLSRDDRHRLEVDAQFSGIEEDSLLETRGYMDAAGAELSYQLAVNGRYERVSDFLRALDSDAYPFAGNLTIDGTLSGDLNGYSLNLDQVGLNQDGVFSFDADGQITQHGSEKAILDIEARGTAGKVDALIPSYGDLAAFVERSEVEVTVTGNLEAPHLEHAALVLYGPGDTRISLLTQTQSIELDQLDSILEEQTANVDVEGTIGNLGELSLASGLTSKEVIDAAGLKESKAAFRGKAMGNMAEMRFELRDLLLTHPDYLLKGSAQLLWREDVFSAPQAEVSLVERSGPGEVQVSGAIADLLKAQGVALATEARQFSVSTLDDALNLDLPAELGPITGEALVLRGGDTLRLKEIKTNIEVKPGIMVELTGDVAHFRDELTADLELQLSDIASDAWQTVSIPLQAPSKFATTLRLRPTYFTALSDLTLGETHIQGVVSGDVDRLELDRMSVDLYTADLHLRDFVKPPSPSKDETPDKPVTLEGLGDSLPDFPVSLTLRSGQVTGPLTQLEDLSIAIDLAQKRITLTKLDTRYAGGELILRGNIDSTVEPLALSLAGRGIRVPLGALTEDLGLQQNVSGSFSFQGGLVTRGDVRAAWENNLQGRLSTALNDVTVSGAAYDLLMSNLLAWLVRGAGEKTTTFSCTMAQFDITAGVARSDSIYIETPRMLATGKASIDLPEHNLDVRIEPRSRSRAIQFPSAIRINGELDDPKVTASALQAGADLSAQALLLLPSLTLKLFGLNGPENPNQPCQTKAS